MSAPFILWLRFNAPFDALAGLSLYCYVFVTTVWLGFKRVMFWFQAYPSMNNEHLVVAASFYAQLILTTEANLDHGLHDIAVSTMLEYLMDHREGNFQTVKFSTF